LIPCRAFSDSLRAALARNESISLVAAFSSVCFW
jgi:hypothetical protein